MRRNKGWRFTVYSLSHKSVGRRTPIEFERQLIKHPHFSGNVLGKVERHCQKNDSNNVEKPVNVFLA
jgi:hypothetical protein